MRVDLFDYELPRELIAQRPADRREDARLLVLDRRTGAMEHRVFREIGSYLGPNDTLVFNDSRVIPARLFGVRESTGGRWEGLFLRTIEAGSSPADPLAELLTHARGRLRAGEWVRLERGTTRLELVEKTKEGTWLARPSPLVPWRELLEQCGHIPLPPYIRKGKDDADDRERYQTVYAREPGSIAAPTAGLHFSAELLERLRSDGVGQEFVSLHVGAGTFRPVSADDTRNHEMHFEWRQVAPEVAQRLRLVKEKGGRVIAVGTTAVRTLESAARTGRIEGGQGWTNLFICPPFEFHAIDGMITNFHLPRSTLLMLVSAWAGRELILRAYREAIDRRYRFFSYGDAMLIR